MGALLLFWPFSDFMIRFANHNMSNPNGIVDEAYSGDTPDSQAISAMLAAYYTIEGSGRAATAFACELRE